MKRLFLLLLLLVPLTPCDAGNNLIFYQVGGRDAPVAKLLKGYFEERGYAVSIYAGETAIEKHVAVVNRINREGQAAFVAARFLKGEKDQVFVASTPDKPDAFGVRTEPEDYFLTLDQVALKHAAGSRRMAEAVAGSFQIKAARLPLFPLLGVDRAGIFLRVEYREENLQQVLFTLNEGLQKYLGRDRKNEK
jgi:hypothetical protein